LALTGEAGVTGGDKDMEKEGQQRDRDE